MSIDYKNISIFIGLLVSLSAFINIVLSIVVPRSEVIDIKNDIYHEINRIEIKMMESDLIRREEQKCSLLYDNSIIEYKSCMESVKYNESMRYMNRNQ
jgi:small nuclear ribonucleoprotein (snRNP)-like protein